MEDSEHSEDETSKLSKKFKHVKGITNAIAQEFVCPLSLELMVDPVTAEDGHHYERAWIEKTIKAQGEHLRSPMAHERMGPKLLPAVRVASTVQHLINSGVVEKGLCDSCISNKLIFDTEKGANS